MNIQKFDWFAFDNRTESIKPPKEGSYLVNILGKGLGTAQWRMIGKGAWVDPQSVFKSDISSSIVTHWAHVLEPPSLNGDQCDLQKGFNSFLDTNPNAKITVEQFQAIWKTAKQKV